MESAGDAGDPVGMAPSTDAARVAALRALGLLDTPAEERFDRIVRIAQQLFGVETAGINLVDRDRQFTKAAVGRLERGDMPRQDSMCTHAIQSDDIFEIRDARADPAWAGHPTVVGDLGLGFYAGIPLRAAGGENVGALCLIDSEPRELSATEHDLLRGLAEMVERELASSAEMEQGRAVQRRLLPQRSPDVPGWEIAGVSLQYGAVGGDFYDWQVLDPTVQIMLCDVMGKGLSAALLAAGVRVVARGTSPHHTLESTVARVSEDLAVDLEETGSFVTAFLARFVPTTGAMEYVDAGHGLAFVVSPGARHRRLGSRDLPIGTLPDLTWQAAHDTVEPGECLVVISDGLLDLYDDVEALMSDIAPHTHGPGTAEDAVRRIAHSGPGRAADDVTVVLARRAAS